MPYQVTKSDGSVLVNLADNTVDTTTSMTLVGRNFPGYGTAVADNFIRLLENGATNGVQPSRPLVGQLWYDTSTSLMKVWTGTVWFSLTTGVSSILGLTGAVNLSQLSIAGLAPLASPAFTGVPTAPTATTGTNSTQVATCAFVLGQTGAIVGGVSSVLGQTGAVTLPQLVAGGMAALGSPALTGVPTAPTADVSANNTQIATTAYVVLKVGALSTGVSSVIGNSGAVTLPQLITGGIAPLASPALSGVPTAPTAAINLATNQIATLSFVKSAITAALPSTRFLLTGDIIFYVSPSGSDTFNSGTQASPFATMQRAYNLLASLYDGGGHRATITLLPGTHTTGLAANAVLIGFPGGVLINSTSTPATGLPTYNSSTTIVTVANGNCFLASGGFTILQIEGLTVSAPSGSDTLIQQSGNCINVVAGAFVILGRGMIFGTTAAFHILIQNAALSCSWDYAITGGAGSGHLVAAELANVSLNGTPLGFATVSLSGTPAFGVFMQAINNSYIAINNIVFAGLATGSRYAVGVNSTIASSGTNSHNSDTTPNQTYLPGSAAGATSNGSFYL